MLRRLVLCGSPQALGRLGGAALSADPVPEPLEGFASVRTPSGARWVRISIPPPPPVGLEVRCACCPDPLPTPLLPFRDAGVWGSEDCEVAGQQEGVHGSAFPACPLPAPWASEEDFRGQAAFRRIGLVEAERRMRLPVGEGVSVVILDSGPEGLPDFDPHLVDLCIPWPLPAKASGGGEGIRSLHGVMIAGIIRRIAPRASIVLVRVLGPGLLGRLSDLASALLWVERLRRSSFPNPAGGEPLIRPLLVFCLGLGLQRPTGEELHGALLAAVDEVARPGAVLCCAAGHRALGGPPHLLEPALYGAVGLTPACWAQVVPVAATSSAVPDRFAPASREAPFAAPGADLLLDCGLEAPGWGRYVLWGGTSFSAAMAAGIAALHLSAGVGPGEVKRRLWEDAARPRLWDGAHLLRVGRPYGSGPGHKSRPQAHAACSSASARCTASSGAST